MKNDNGDHINENRDILAEIAEYTKKRIEKKKEIISIETLKEESKRFETGSFPFEEALLKKGMSFICEVKKASPSKGLIAEEFPYLDIAKEYELAGASAISCLTEPKYFKGHDSYLEHMAKEVSIPILRKDFVVDEYMIYESKILGASAVLLICAILKDEELARYFSIANELGLSVVFEAHDEEEVLRAAAIGARVIGVNNRNLKTFELDLNNSIRLRKLVSVDTIFVSESGIKTRNDIELLENHKVDAVLIGESFMRSNNKKALLLELKGMG